MQQLFELFAPNVLGSAVIKKFKSGDRFLLRGKAALVLEGVVAVDGIVPDFGTTITLRLAGEEDVLNIEEVVGLPEVDQEYCCETPTCVVAIVSLEHFQNQLSSNSQEVRTAISQVLLSRVFHNYNQVMITVAGLSYGTSKDQAMWALRRYQEITGLRGALPIKKGRLAVHIGTSLENISRSLRHLAEDGMIEMTHRTIRLVEA